MIQNRDGRTNLAPLWLKLGGSLAICAVCLLAVRSVYGSVFQNSFPAADRQISPQGRGDSSSSELVDENRGYSDAAIPLDGNLAAANPSSVGDLKVAPPSAVDFIFQQAEILQKRSWFRAAYDLLQTVPQHHSRYAEARQKMVVYASAILERANDRYLKGDLGTAVQYLEAVPEGTEAAVTANKNLPFWKRQAAILANANQLLEREQWSEASLLFQRLQDHPFYSSPKIQHQLRQGIVRTTDLSTERNN
ncbi:hypothetical protein ACQ4M3_13415 [Leptolyngbya sp. AN03gr2]|uniref:hypothetical protein n=1 Tax=unclassified Leptolyngbya TaxID=2650499 RepID=UPI003D310357